MLVVHAGILLAGAMQAIHGSQAVYGSLASASLPLRLLQTWGTSLFVIWIWFVALQRHDEERSALHERSDPQERSQD